MAKVTKEAQQSEEEKSNPQDQLNKILKDTKEDHYNYEKDHNYKVPCSSLLLTGKLGGGLTPGAHRMVGLSTGGKTSCALDFLYHFLKSANDKVLRRGVYIKAEGRLSEEIQNRSGVKFVKKPEEWANGTCFIFESNIYESVFKLKRNLITDNPHEVEYFFITDSADNLIKREDAKKPEEESITVGGGSLITSVFLKKVGLAMEKRGHISIYISQVRDQIKINPYEVTIPKQGKASGARALEHQAGIVLEFLPRFGGDVIYEGGDKKGKILGHYAKVRIIKSDNEKNGLEVEYPIRYNQTGAKSVWVSYELVDCLLMWGVLKKKGAWLVFDDDFRQEMATSLKRHDIPEQLNGQDKARKWVEENVDVQKYLFDKFKDVSF